MGLFQLSVGLQSEMLKYPNIGLPSEVQIWEMHYDLSAWE